MVFGFTEEQELFRKSVREFAEKEITPRVREIDEEERIPAEIIKGLAKLGLLGIMISPQYGGSAADVTTAAIAAEELGRVDISGSIAAFYLVRAAWGYIFDKYGAEKAKEELLPKVIRGERSFGVAITEPNAGSDLMGLKTMIRKEKDGYVINGEKMYISGVKEALEYGGGYLTLAKSAPELGHRGMTFCYVPIKDNPGINTTMLRRMGRTGTSFGGFVMKNVRVPAHYIIGELNRGFYYGMEGFNIARIFVSACCVGAAESALEQGMKYIKQRRAFGRPIGKFEGIQFELAEDYTKVEAARLLTYKAAWMVDEMYKKKLFTHSDVNKAAAMAKLYAPVISFNAINDAMTWHGAYGYTTECPLEMGLRGIRAFSIGAEGALAIMKTIIARELLGEEFLPYR